WLKIRTRKTDDLIIVGYTAPKGNREGFGALHLAQYVNGRLVYSGRAGSGFSGPQLAEVHAQLEARRRRTPPCEGPVPKDRTTTWVEPEVVCEVEYTEWTEEGLLRQPVFLRFRDDKRPEEGKGRERTGSDGRRSLSRPLPPSPACSRPRREPACAPSRLLQPQKGLLAVGALHQ